MSADLLKSCDVRCSADTEDATRCDAEDPLSCSGGVKEDGCEMGPGARNALSGVGATAEKGAISDCEM